MTPDAPSSDPRTGSTFERLSENICSVFLGDPRVVRLALVALLAEGHLLLEDVPGTGKTLLAKALAQSINSPFSRIQFTPDLLPSDLLGTMFFDQRNGEFSFRRGPVFAPVVLADEINRATPRTQSALLEAMAEGQVTLDGTTHQLGVPFFVVATQNPYEFEGTYPLPESQLDRFLVCCRLGYPSESQEGSILEMHRGGPPIKALRAVLEKADVLALQAATRRVRFDPALVEYLLGITRATRRHPAVALGASTRAALGLYRAAQAMALASNRDHVVPDDVRDLVGSVFSHRLVLKDNRTGGAEAVVDEILADVKVPQ